MLLSIENLPYWIVLGAGGILFIAILSGQSGRRTPATGNRGKFSGASSGPSQSGTMPSPPDALSSGQLADVVAPDPSRKAQASFPLRMALTLTLWGLIGWTINVAVGASLGTMPQGLLAFAIVTITLILALVLSHQLVSPLRWVINSRRQTMSFDPLVGCTGTVSSEHLYKLAEGDVAQIEVVDSQGDVLVVNAALPPWATVTPHHGDRVTLIEHSDEVHLYYAVASDSPDQDNWLQRAASI